MARLRIVLSINSRNLDRKLERLRNLPVAAERIMEQTALESLGRLIEATPKKWTGDTRKQWVHRKLGPMQHVLSNPSRVMHWLEYGTKAHGPVNAKALFIPLTRRAAEAGPRQVMEENARAHATNTWQSYGAVVRGKKPITRKPWQVGRDFVWAKKVKGIRAMRIAKKEQTATNRILKQRLTSEIRKAVR